MVLCCSYHKKNKVSPKNTYKIDDSLSTTRLTDKFMNEHIACGTCHKVFGLHQNGQKQFETIYKDGKVNGYMKIWLDNGNLFREVEMAIQGKDSLPEMSGTITNYWMNGEKSTTGKVVNGLPYGLRTSWHENGQKSAEAWHENGIAISQICWDESGKILCRVSSKIFIFYIS